MTPSLPFRLPPRFNPSPTKRVAAVTALASLFLGVGCFEENKNTAVEYNASPLLGAISANVIAATYAHLARVADSLNTAVSDLKVIPDSLHLAAAQQAWRATRRPWEQSEAFIFGPVETEGIDPSIDSWPLNKVDLDQVLAGTATLTKTYIDGLEGTQKGFHTVEYLLFGSHAHKKAANLTPRELDYLTAVTASFSGSVHQLDDAWAASKGNYTAMLANAGKGDGSPYISGKAGLQELIGGMVGICDEVANGKIADPFSQQDRSLEESQFSDNSVADFADNIRSVQNVYLGRYANTDGFGIEDFVKSRDAALAITVAQAIEDAITTLEAIKPNFGVAITEDKLAVEKAQQAVRLLQELLESRVQPLLEG
jgi:putative iron-regulated protein